MKHSHPVNRFQASTRPKQTWAHCIKCHSIFKMDDTQDIFDMYCIQCGAKITRICDTKPPKRFR